MESLQVLTGPLSGVTLRLVKARTMGRSPSCALALHDVLASRRHASIPAFEDRCQIAALDSRNGTFVNSVRLVGPRVRGEGDDIRVGDTTALFLDELGDLPSAFAPRVPPRWASSVSDRGLCFSENTFDAGRPPIMVGAAAAYLRTVGHAHSVSPFMHVPWLGNDCLSNGVLFAQSLAGIPSSLHAVKVGGGEGDALCFRRIDKLSVEALPELPGITSQFERKLSNGFLVSASSTKRGSRLSLRRELAKMFEVRTFRIPPLLERLLDVVPLIEVPPVLGAETRRVHSLHYWPGNIREIKMNSGRFVLRHSGAEFSPQQLPSGSQSSRQILTATSLDMRSSQVERDAVIDALTQTRGKKIHAAKISGISRPASEKKIAEYTIKTVGLRRCLS